MDVALHQVHTLFIPGPPGGAEGGGVCDVVEGLDVMGAPVEQALGGEAVPA